MTPDGCNVVQRRTITHNSPPCKSSYGVVKADVTVAYVPRCQALEYSD